METKTLRTVQTQSLDASLALYTVGGDFLFGWVPGDVRTEVRANEDRVLALRVALVLVNPPLRYEVIAGVCGGDYLVVVDATGVPLYYRVLEANRNVEAGVLDLLLLREDAELATEPIEGATAAEPLEPVGTAATNEAITRGLARLWADVARCEGAHQLVGTSEFNLYAGSGQLILMRRFAVPGCELALETEGRLVLRVEAVPATQINRAHHRPELLETGRMVIVQVPWAAPLDLGREPDLLNERTPGLSRLYQVTEVQTTLDPNLVLVELTAVPDEAYQLLPTI